jgi:hypothetical protein
MSPIEGWTPGDQPMRPQPTTGERPTERPPKPSDMRGAWQDEDGTEYLPLSPRERRFLGFMAEAQRERDRLAGWLRWVADHEQMPLAMTTLISGALCGDPVPSSRAEGRDDA